MEVDTGAAFSVTSEATYKSTLPEVKLHKSTIVLKTYTDEHIPVIGQLHVHVTYGDQRAPLVQIIVVEDGPTLLGRNWLKYIRLDWKSIHQIAAVAAMAEGLANLLNKYDELFWEQSETIEPALKSEKVLPLALSTFNRFLSRPKQHSMTNSPASKVSHSRWAAPIVAVSKKNGKYRWMSTNTLFPHPSSP